ncbi:MAG: hypothetical protein RL033_3700 [Pseudomonadota bacterium]|jgi:uncharacterized repeat protein (TIGR03806 family)
MSDSLGRCPGLAFSFFAASIVAACGSVDQGQQVFEPGVGDPGERPPAFLKFPADTVQAPRAESELPPDFPRLLSQTGAFEDVASMAPRAGLISYEIQAPLWSDGAIKTRWVSVPELGGIGVLDDDAWRMPEGTVFVKHFEMAMDERQPLVRRRLETRLLIAAQGGAYYGVTYKWRADNSDAELLLAGVTESLSITDETGNQRLQPYLYPSSRDCNTCHNPSAGHVLGMRTRQLNREHAYRSDFPPINQLVIWAGWGLLDRSFDNTDAQLAPHLAELQDESAELQDRVRSYWDGNCSMCHAGNTGAVTGWDARAFTPFADQGLNEPPRSSSPDTAELLITPGDPGASYIYQRGASAEVPLRMPPIGRNRVDGVYLDVLQRWISSL